MCEVILFTISAYKFGVYCMYCILFPPSKETKFLIVYLLDLDVRCFLNSFCDLLEQKGVGDNDAGIPFSNGLVQNETK